jgi:hypothetical protein
MDPIWLSTRSQMTASLQRRSILISLRSRVSLMTFANFVFFYDVE